LSSLFALRLVFTIDISWYFADLGVSNSRDQEARILERKSPSREGVRSFSGFFYFQNYKLQRKERKEEAQSNADGGKD